MPTVSPGTGRILAEIVPLEDPLYGEESKLIVSEVLTPEAKEERRSMLFRIVSVGEGVTNYSPGDIVFREAFMPVMRIVFQGKTLVVLNEPSIVGKLILDIPATQIN